MPQRQTKLFNKEERKNALKEKKCLLTELNKKTPNLSLFKKTNSYVFVLFTEEEKENLWKAIKNDVEYLLELIQTNRADIFPEKAFNYIHLRNIFSNGVPGIIESFIRSQFYRKGMKKFLISEKYRQLIMEKIGLKTYLEVMEEISRDKKLAKKRK